ncbi:hypothetical protein PHYPO_G00125840 [Pangasianodon hypophthalmus]|uniref:Uncharacterized protein n=1 Tax=Pangasianodon hypophthalmus TaxID=310915 RepID=A0A5N5KRB6_PANHP|nr:hypothetical protein PHYPO_G00125840 [Pangasianodon hypophthalmus]
MASLKLPGALVPAMRLRFSRRLTLFLFLSALLTLCGFCFLTDPLLLERFFLTSSASASAVATESSAIGQRVEKPNTPAGMTPERENATEDSSGARGNGSDYSTFQKCLLKPALGSDRGQPGSNQTAQRRDTVREQQTLYIHRAKEKAFYKTKCTKKHNRQSQK